MNTRLLRRIQKHISEIPQRFVMGDVVITKSDDTSRVVDWSAGRDEDLRLPAHEFAPCGTAACIAGWALILSGKTPRQANRIKDYERHGGRLLGLTDQQAHRLFHVEWWPTTHGRKYAHALTPEERVKIAVERINDFIATNGQF